MDNFTELLLTKKKSGKDTAMQAGFWIVSVFFIAVMCYIAFRFFALLFLALPLLIALIMYGNITLMGMMNVEFEYSLVNNYIDIDKIVGKKTRSRLLSLTVKEITSIGKFDYKQINREKYSRVFTPVSSLDAENLWYFTAEKEDGQTYFVVFEPNRRILEHLKKFITRNVTKGVLDEF